MFPRSMKLTSKLPFRRRTAATAANSPAEVPIPTHFRCPVSLDLMKDPVTLPTGITYDRPSIETWLEAGNRTCPVTNQPLALPAHDEITPNHAIRHLIQDWCVAHRSLGVDRIPTPKTPITALQVSELLAEISVASRGCDPVQCSELVAELMNRIAESERNRRCIMSNGAGTALAAVFKDSPSEQVLSVLVRMLPLDEEARRQLASAETLNSLILILRNGSRSGRLHAILMVKEMAASDAEQAAEIATSDGLIEAIARLIKEPISPQATKASLVAAYYLASCDDLLASRLTEMGIIPVLLDMLVDAEKSLCEKGLAVLDAVLSSGGGREWAACHALTVPVLVKKMLRVSDAATEFAVSGMWKLCKMQRNGGDGGKCLREALQVGAFQKLLLLLQVGCSDSTKEKANELLRLLNGFRDAEDAECIETVDFKRLKRPF